MQVNLSSIKNHHITTTIIVSVVVVVALGALAAYLIDMGMKHYYIEAHPDAFKGSMPDWFYESDLLRKRFGEVRFLGGDIESQLKGLRLIYGGIACIGASIGVGVAAPFVIAVMQFLQEKKCEHATSAGIPSATMMSALFLATAIFLLFAYVTYPFHADVLENPRESWVVFSYDRELLGVASDVDSRPLFVGSFLTLLVGGGVGTALGAGIAGGVGIKASYGAMQEEMQKRRFVREEAARTREHLEQV